MNVLTMLAHGAHGEQHNVEGVAYHVLEYGIAAVVVVTVITAAALVYRHVSRKAEKVEVRSKD